MQSFASLIHPAPPVIRGIGALGIHRAIALCVMVKSPPLELLFTWTIRSVYSAETQLARILPRIVRRTSGDELREMFENIAELTECHLARLELISRRHHLPLTEKGADGMRGIIEEIIETLADDDDDNIVTDLALIDLMEKAGHYRQAAYSSALLQALALEWTHAVATIETILEEEEEISTTLGETTRYLGTMAGEGGRRGKTCFTLNAGRRGRAPVSPRRF